MSVRLLDEFCPDCGSRRVALFRWCRTCGLDFDELDARGDLPGGPYSGSASPAVAVAAAMVGPSTASTRAAASGGDPTEPSSRRFSILRRRSSRRPISRSLAIGLALGLVVGLLGGAYAADLAGVQGAVATFASDPGGIVPAAAVAPSAVPSPVPEPSFTPSGPTSQAAVVRVIDGDTIVVRAGGVELYVRYLGMDAPEAVTPDTAVQFMAPEAAQANAQLVSGQTVILERDQSESDGYGRLLRHVWVDRDGTLFLVGLELVKAGFARATPVPPDTKYQALYADAQAQAQAAGLGIWGAPPSAEPGATLPPSGAGPASLRLTTNDPVTIANGVSSDLHGGEGSYTWRAVNLTVPAVKVGWTVDASAEADCTLEWLLLPASATPVEGKVDVIAKGHKTAKSNHETTFDRAMLTVTSTCPSWRLSIVGVGG